MASFSVSCYLKMAPSKERCCEVIKLYYQRKSLNTVVKTIRKYHLEHLIQNRFTELLSDLRSLAQKQTTCKDWTSEVCKNLEQVKIAINETPQRSVWTVFADITNFTSVTS